MTEHFFHFGILIILTLATFFILFTNKIRHVSYKLLFVFVLLFVLLSSFPFHLFHASLNQSCQSSYASCCLPNPHDIVHIVMIQPIALFFEYLIEVSFVASFASFISPLHNKSPPTVSV